MKDLAHDTAEPDHDECLPALRSGVDGRVRRREQQGQVDLVDDLHDHLGRDLLPAQHEVVAQ